MVEIPKITATVNVLKARIGSTVSTKGKQGDPGKSAYESAREGGYLGSEAEFNRDLSDLPNKAPYIYMDERDAEETAARENADQNLQQRIDDEIIAREQAIREAVTAEENARAASDDELTGKIDDEAEERRALTSIDLNDKVITQSMNGLLAHLSITHDPATGKVRLLGKNERVQVDTGEVDEDGEPIFEEEEGDAFVLSEFSLPIDTFLDGAEIVTDPDGQIKLKLANSINDVFGISSSGLYFKMIDLYDGASSAALPTGTGLAIVPLFQNIRKLCLGDQEPGDDIMIALHNLRYFFRRTMNMIWHPRRTYLGR